MSPLCFLEFEGDPITLGLGPLLEAADAGRVSNREDLMSSITLADRIRANRPSRSPVQDTVGEHFGEISAALAAGVSFRDLYRQLTREGRNVGRSHTSLFSAYKAVKARRNEPSSLDRRDIAEPARIPANPAKMSAPANQLRNAVVPAEMPAAVIDTRRKTNDW